MSNETAILAGGCFWCLEAAYEQVQGVTEVVSGYTGGSVVDPSYQAVCTGTTGHAEAVKVTYDADSVSFRELLELFFTLHDPTTLNRQGPDVGTQYRSVVFYRSAEQEGIAREVIDEVTTRGAWPNPIVTEVLPDAAFYEAEDYHREYYRRNAGQPYCQIVIAPKIAKLRQEWLKLLRS